MSVSAILGELGRRGITVRSDGRDLFLKPRPAADEELLVRVRRHKEEIIRALAATRVPEVPKPSAPEAESLEEWLEKDVIDSYGQVVWSAAGWKRTKADIAR